MSIPTTNVGANPQVPGATAQVFIPDQLIAGNMKIVTDTITLGAGKLPRGAVLGQVTASGAYILSVKTANDGSQVPSAILAESTDATAGPVGTAGYLGGEFNASALTIDATWNVGAVKTALRTAGIFVKSAISAAAAS